MTPPLARAAAVATMAHRVPVLEIGGTHVTSAWATVAGQVEVIARTEIDNSASAADLARALGAAGAQLSARTGEVWGVAIPGPFDYDRGIGDFTGVGKFGAWHGHDLGADLCEVLGARAVYFINDADAFGVGEAMAGKTRGCRRSLGLTLGTGIGSAFVVEGTPVVSGPGVPPLGEVHVLTHQGVPLEHRVSRGAIREAWQKATGEWVEVKPIAEKALSGDAVALGVFREAYRVLAEVICPVVHGFEAEGIVLGGSIARSQPLVEQFFTPLVTRADGSPMPVWFSDDPERSAIVGAAHWALARDQGASYS